MQQETRVFHVFLTESQTSLIKRRRVFACRRCLLRRDLTPFGLFLSLAAKGVVFKMSLIICCLRRGKFLLPVPFFKKKKACRKKDFMIILLFHCFKIGLVYLEGWLTDYVIVIGRAGQKIMLKLHAFQKTRQTFCFFFTCKQKNKCCQIHSQSFTIVFILVFSGIKHSR